MEKTSPTIAQRIAKAALVFEKNRTGHAPRAVTVVLGGDTLVITLHGALTPAELALAATETGAAKMTEFHRELFNANAATFLQEIKEIAGVEVREAKAEVETTTGTVVQVFTTGTLVQVYLLTNGVLAESWTQTDKATQK